MKITKKLLKRIILEAMEEEERGSGLIAKLEAKLENFYVDDYEREDFMPVALKTASMMKPEAQKDLEALLDAGAMEHFTEDWNAQPEGLLYMVAYAHDPVGENKKSYFEDIVSNEYDDVLKAFVRDTGNPVAKKILNLVLKHILDRHEQTRREDDEYEEMLAQGRI